METKGGQPLPDLWKIPFVFLLPKQLGKGRRVATALVMSTAPGAPSWRYRLLCPSRRAPTMGIMVDGLWTTALLYKALPPDRTVMDSHGCIGTEGC